MPDVTEQVQEVHVQQSAKEEENTVQLEQAHVAQHQQDTNQQDVTVQITDVLVKVRVAEENTPQQEQEHVQI